MNIQWIIEQMWVKPQVDGEADVVVTAAWRCNGRDGCTTSKPVRFRSERL